MKFTIDTKSKQLVLEESISFEELESLKKFIGEGWEKWTIAKTAGEVVHHYKDWHYYRPWWNNDYGVTAGFSATNGFSKANSDSSNLCISGDSSKGVFAMNCSSENLNSASLKELYSLNVL